MNLIKAASLVALSALLIACGDTSNQQDSAEASSEPAVVPDIAARTPGYSEHNNAYFGDLHVHTMYSFDAFIFGTTASPDDAYEFAKGLKSRWISMVSVITHST